MKQRLGKKKKRKKERKWDLLDNKNREKWMSYRKQSCNLAEQSGGNTDCFAWGSSFIKQFRKRSEREKWPFYESSIPCENPKASRKGESRCTWPEDKAKITSSPWRGALMKKGAVNGGRFLTLCQTVTDFSGSLSLFTCLEFSLKNCCT